MMERTTGRLAKDRAWMQEGGCRMERTVWSSPPLILHSPCVVTD